MVELLSALFSLIVEAILSSFKYIGNFTIRFLLPKRQRHKWEHDSEGAFILGAIIFLVAVIVSWWFLIGLKH